MSRWKPQLPTRGSGIGPLVAFGAHQTAGNFIFGLARGCDNLLIGRFYGPAAVGLYSRAAALVSRPMEQFLLPIDAVFLPTLSRLQSQPERYRSTFLRLYEAIAMSVFFFSSLLLALAMPANFGIVGTKVAAGECHFCRFHIYGDSTSAFDCCQLAAHQPGTRQRYFSCHFDQCCY